MSEQLDSQLKESVRYLGATLGDTIRAQMGEEWLERIEKVRICGRQSHGGDDTSSEQLKSMFSELSNEDLLTIGRALLDVLS